jgi:hypothetical protein
VTDSQRGRVGRERVQRVGVDHDGHGRFGNQAAACGLRAVVAPEPGTDRERTEAGDVLEHDPRRILVELAAGRRGERTGDNLTPAGDGSRGTGQSAHDHTGARTRRGSRGQHRCTGHARRASEHEQRRRPLVSACVPHRKREIDAFGHTQTWHTDVDPDVDDVHGTGA